MSPPLTANTVHGETGVLAGVYLVVVALILLTELATLLCKQLHMALPAHRKLCSNPELAQSKNRTFSHRLQLFNRDVQFLVPRALGL